MTALSTANLVETFCAAGDYTVFAPTNEAFAALPDGVLDAVLADTLLLTEILTYHVSGSSLSSDEVIALTEIPTLNGETVSVSLTDEGVTLNGTALIIAADVVASNGVIHVITAVLLPPQPPEPGFCAGFCGGESAEGQCFCDELCSNYGDCCDGICDDCTTLSFCQPEPECDANSISGLASANGDLSTLVTALTEADLVTTFCEAGDFTVFAPTNAAFAALSVPVGDILGNADLLNAVLTNHVISGSQSGAQLGLETSYTALNGTEFSVALNGAGELIINGNAKVIISDISATNGVIHVVDAVIIEAEPSEPGLCEGACGDQSSLANCFCDEQCEIFGDCCSDVCTYCASLDHCGGSSSNCSADSIGGIIEKSPEFVTLNSALEAADLKTTFCTEGDFTVFAPTNAAFEALGDTLDAVLADQALLNSILTYHAAAGEFLASEVAGLSAIPTLNGKSIGVEVTGDGVILNGSAKIISADLIAENGVIHVIDAVLLPPDDPEPSCDPNSIAGIAEANGNFTTLLTALELAGLTDTFCDAGDFTVFAPTDAAFAALGDTLNAVLADEELLNNILTYHVALGSKDSAEVLSAPFVVMLNGVGITVESIGGEVLINGSVVISQVDIQASNGIIHVLDGVLLPPADTDTLSVGQECWNEIKACGAGLTCTLNADLSVAQCYPELTKGDACGPGQGACGAGSDCVLSGGSTLCLPKQLSGSACGDGVGLCVEGSSCSYDDASETTATCQPLVGNGGFCGGVAQGDCKEGAQCISASANPPFVNFCFTDELPGDPCGPGKGLCTVGHACVYDDASETSATCLSDGGEFAGCGGFGLGGCTENLGCLFANATATSGVCAEAVLATGSCGFGVGVCEEGLSCGGGTCQ